MNAKFILQYTFFLYISCIEVYINANVLKDIF